MLRRAFRAMVFVGAGASLAMLLPACGPIEYIANMPLDATGAIAQARTAKGDKLAPYEITAALEYQHKSRELAGYARWHSSVAFARKAAANAKLARKLASERASLPADQASHIRINACCNTGS